MAVSTTVPAGTRGRQQPSALVRRPHVSLSWCRRRLGTLCVCGCRHRPKLTGQHVAGAVAVLLVLGHGKQSGVVALLDNHKGDGGRVCGVTGVRRQVTAACRFAQRQAGCRRWHGGALGCKQLTLGVWVSHLLACLAHCAVLALRAQACFIGGGGGGGCGFGHPGEPRTPSTPGFTPRDPPHPE
jgi:hypothetical protein